MKFTLLLFSIMAFYTPGFSSIPDAIPASNPLIEYSGRIDFSNRLAPRFSYSGVSIRFSTMSAMVNVILNDEKGENYFALIIDECYNGKIKTLKGKNSYLLSKDLSEGIHEFELVKITEEMFGKVSFEGIITNDNFNLVKNEHERIHTIEFIGNSITCGYGNEGVLGDIFGASTENHYMTYAAITARSFEANPLVVCKSGIGIYRNYDGPITGNKDCMPNFYDRIYLYDSLPKYEFSIQPDLVCINLGTNDFSTSGVGSKVFIDAYLRFIEQIEQKYKNPEIVCILGPMLGEAALNNARKCIMEVVEKAQAKNNGKVHFFEMSQQSGNFGIGTDYHPTVEQHIVTSMELTEFISRLKGWEIKPRLIYGKMEQSDQIYVFSNRLDYLKGIKQEQVLITIDGQTIKVSSLKLNEKMFSMEIKFEYIVKPGQQVKIQIKLDNNKTETLLIENKIKI